MADVTFASFTLEASPAVTDYLVGYRTPIAGGERRTTLSSLNSLFQANITAGLTAGRVLISGATSNLEASDLAYTSPTLTVPAGFVINGAGSLAFTAGGSNQNVTITPSGGTGAFSGAFTYQIRGTANVPGLALIGDYGASINSQVAFDATVYGQAGSNSYPRLALNRARGSLSSPAELTNGDTYGAFVARGYSNGTFSATAEIDFVVDGTVTANQRPPSRMEFYTNVSNGSQLERMRIEGMGRVSVGRSAASSAAWGVTGAILSSGNPTITDSSSSGTVATAVANSFAVPTFAASSATTFTNAANLYIAGDVVNGTNVTLTNSYGLWNAGKTRLDGAVSFGSSGGPTITGSGNNLNSATASNGSITNTPNGIGYFRVDNGLTGLLSGNVSGGVQRPVRVGQSRILNFDDGMVSQNLGAVSGADTYATLATGNYSGMEFNFIDSNSRGVRFITSTATSTSGTAFTPNYTLAVSGGAAAQLTGGAGNMTITAGTGNSRTLTLQTTTSGGVATNAVVFSATQSAAFNGPIIEKVSALTYASPTSVDVTLANTYTVTTVNATGSVTFNATAAGTSGQPMTIIITNDATSAKTITFGSNFTANGTLTASGASKKTTIQFISDGTAFIEVSRTVLP